MRRVSALLAILASLGYSALSAGLPTLSAGGAQAIDRMFQAAVDKGEIPGVVAAVTNKDQILYLKAFGRQDVANRVPMTKNTVFRIASMTKPVTSAGIMMLYERASCGSTIRWATTRLHTRAGSAGHVQREGRDVHDAAGAQ